MRKTARCPEAVELPLISFRAWRMGRLLQGTMCARLSFHTVARDHGGIMKRYVYAWITLGSSAVSIPGRWLPVRLSLADCARDSGSAWKRAPYRG